MTIMTPGRKVVLSPHQLERIGLGNYKVVEVGLSLITINPNDSLTELVFSVLES